MINIHRVTALEIERNNDWTSLNITSNEISPSHFSLALQIADKYENVFASDLLDIIKEHFENEEKIIEVALFHKDSKPFDIKITENYDA